MKRVIFIFLQVCLIFSLSAKADDVLKVVVLGSSTAAGTGPTDPAKRWVDQYRVYLQTINPANEVINLAVGGYNTYRIMPDGNSVAGRPAPITSKNITKALTYNPNVIIVNMPTNDVAEGFSTAEVMSNYQAVVDVAATKNIPIYFTTTQPRNFSDPAQLQQLIEIKDLTLSTYPDNTIDFWTTLAEPDGRINPLYNSGDGIHLNNDGHDILVNRVKAVSSILTYAAPVVSSDPILYAESIKIDFGSSQTNATGWNNLVGFDDLGSANAVQLVDADGNATAASVYIEKSFSAVNTGGTTSPSTSLNYPASATKDSFYGYTVAGGNFSSPITESEIVLQGLTVNKRYNLTFFASRTGVSDNRETKYEVKGQLTQTVFLDAATNIGNVVNAIDIYPDADGKITVNVTPGPNNTNANKFYYIGVLQLSYEAPLPVKLTYFKGKKQKGATQLEWATSYEKNNSHFEVEKKIVGGDFEKIAEIPSKGEMSNGANYYQYVDDVAINDAVYYRLKQVDNDGKFEYSPVVYIKNALSQDIQIYPNPTSEKINIKNTLNQPIALKMLDSNGRVIFEKEGITGYYTLNIQAYPKGVYFFQFSSVNGVTVKKVVVN